MSTDKFESDLNKTIAESSEGAAEPIRTASDIGGNGHLPPPTTLSAVDGYPSDPIKPMTEVDQIKAIQRMNTNFVFLFGSQQRGKTVITSSVLNFLSGVEAEGNLVPVKNIKGSDYGNQLLSRLRRVFSESRFPERTVLIDGKEPIYVNVKFTPKNLRDHKEIFLTFLEMPGDHLKKIDAPDGGLGELPANIDVFFKTTNVKILFILVTDHTKAYEDDQLIATFIDYVNSVNKDFARSNYLLLVAKWDEYDGGLDINEFVKSNMRLTHAKLHNEANSISDFSIGAVGEADGKPFLKEFDSVPSKAVINWIYTQVHGKPLYKKSIFQRILGKFLKYS